MLIKPVAPLAVLCSAAPLGWAAASASTAAASPASSLERLLDTNLNIYWTFGLMPIAWEASYIMCIKATGKVLQEAGLQMNISECSLLGPRILSHASDLSLRVTFLQCFFFSFIGLYSSEPAGIRAALLEKPWKADSK